jgi:hypothetical protein
MEITIKKGFVVNILCLLTTIIMLLLKFLDKPYYVAGGDSLSNDTILTVMLNKSNPLSYYEVTKLFLLDLVKNTTSAKCLS